MSAGSSELQLAFVNPMDQQPIGLDMRVARTGPIASECVVSVSARQFLAREEQFEQNAELTKVLAATLDALHVLPELS